MLRYKGCINSLTDRFFRLIIIFIAILLVMILSPKELRPEFNNTQVGTTPLLTLSFPLKGVSTESLFLKYC